ncbi:MAG: Gfo/Idh/MocA family oxidoreductase [Gloeobacteraceae cyanobacterium ES-bin-144]|nr:Gfo/Idh/MocA family oxidoreductase [Verrucomicrobiales bacterium]
MNPTPSSISRRDFLSRTIATAGAGLVLSAPNILRAAQPGASDTLHVALVGFGKQGEVLFNCLKNIPGLHFQAVCDISAWNLKKGIGQVRSIQEHVPKGYMDIDEMLATEKGLDCAIIATPDFWHSPHTVKCLEAGLNVYCEKMMSNSIDGARAMVKAMEKTGKLCQIGHQRRSNPRYRFVLDHLINGQKICGQIININGQWNRSLGSSQDIGGDKIPKGVIVPEDVLNKYGFKNMHQFLNWRIYRDLSGGPISDLGAHQIDIFNWFLGAKPKSVFASGGNDYFKKREHFDNVMCIFDYDTPQGGVRAFYQVLTTTSAGAGFWESFMGTEATIKISEIASASSIYREDGAPQWDNLVDRGFLIRKPAPPKPEPSSGAVASYASAAPEAFELPGDLPPIMLKDGKMIIKPAHQPHLENFFNSVRGKEKLHCDAREAFESEAPIYWVNQSALTRLPIEFTSEHLSV